MKNIEVTCESCGASFVVPASMAGQEVQCACGQGLEVPTSEEGEVGIDSEASDVSAISEQEGGGAEGGDGSAATKWYVFIKGEKYGPYSTDKMREMVQEGRLKAHTKAYNKGLSDWIPMGKILTFVGEFEEEDVAVQVGTPVKETMAESTEEIGWHFRRDGIAIGPVSLESLQENARSGELIPEQEVSGPETEEWKPAGEVEELQGLFPPAEERTGYYVSVSGERDGPHSENDIREKIEQGELSADSRIWSQSFGEWQKLSEVSQFADALGGSEASEGAVEEIPRSEEQIPQEAEGVAAEKAEEKIEEQPAESAHEEEALSEAVEIETGETEPHEMEEEPVSEYEVGTETGPEEESPVEGPIAEEEPVGFAEEGIPEPDEGVIEEPVEEAFMPEEPGEEPVEEFPHEAGIEPAVEEAVEAEEEVAVNEGREEGEEGPEAEISVAEAEAPEQAEETEEPEVATEAEEAELSDIREQLEGAAEAGVEGAESEVEEEGAEAPAEAATEEVGETEAVEEVEEEEAKPEQPAETAAEEADIGDIREQLEGAAEAGVEDAESEVEEEGAEAPAEAATEEVGETEAVEEVEEEEAKPEQPAGTAAEEAEEAEEAEDEEEVDLGLVVSESEEEEGLAELAEQAEEETSEDWYYARDGDRYGPYSLEEIQDAVLDGEIDTEDKVWAEHLSGWMPPAYVPELGHAVRTAAAWREAMDMTKEEEKKEGPQPLTLTEALTQIFLQEKQGVPSERKRTDVAQIPSTVLTVEYVDGSEGIDAALKSLDQRLTKLENLTESLEEVTSQLVTAVTQQSKDMEQFMDSINRRVDRVYQQVREGVTVAGTAPAAAGAEAGGDLSMPPRYDQDEDHQHAWQIAQVMANDLEAYYGNEVREGVMYGNLEELLEEPLKEAKKTYEERVDDHVVEEFDYFDLAMKQLIARKKEELAEEGDEE